jgi:dienelactone hydrolase
VAACSSHGAPDPEVLFDANTGAVGADSAPPNGADAGASEAAVSNDAGDSSVSVADAASMDAGVLDASMSDAARADAGSDGATTSDAGLDGAAADGASDAARDGASGDGASGDGSVSDAGIDAAPSPGPYAVGTMRIELVIDAQRTIPVQLWYPAVETARAEASQGHPTAEFEPPGARRDQLSTMLANSPDACTNKTMHGALGAEVASLPQPFPALVFSHCQDCVRFSTFTVSEHLASQGFVIAAPDHVRGTIYDATGLLDEAFLQTRSNDARKVIDLLLDGASSLLPAGLRGKIDPSRIGMYGHSYGSITTGRTLRDDARVKAGSMIAAPIDLGSPLNSVLPGAADVTKLKQPALFFEGLEDQALFTLFIDDNFARYPNPTWLVQLKDGGHWSFTDIAGFNGTFSSGCGTAVRQGTLFDNFSFVDIVRARNITKAYLAAFFMFELNGDASAKSYLDQATPVDLVTLKRRP